MKSFLFAGVIVILSPAVSYSFCSKPDAPYCATRYGEFNDQYDFDRCKREMESYKGDIESYLRCQNMELDRIRSESQQSIDDYNDAVSGFNQRARG